MVIKLAHLGAELYEDGQCDQVIGASHSDICTDWFPYAELSVSASQLLNFVRSLGPDLYNIPRLTLKFDHLNCHEVVPKFRL